MATKKVSMRSIVVELPEEQMMRLVKAAQHAGVDTHAFVTSVLTEAAKAKRT